MKIIRTETNRPDLEAKNMTGNLIPFRAPHWSCNPAQVCDELLAAAGGVLYLSDAAEFDFDAIEALADDLSAMTRNGDPLPLAIIVDVYDANVDPDREGRIEKIIETLSASTPSEVY